MVKHVYRNCRVSVKKFYNAEAIKHWINFCMALNLRTYDLKLESANRVVIWILEWREFILSYEFSMMHSQHKSVNLKLHHV